MTTAPRLAAFAAAVFVSGVSSPVSARGAHRFTVNCSRGEGGDRRGDVRPTFAKRYVVCIGCAVLLGACAMGTQFTRPAQDAVQLGVTTRAQIEARLGKPEEEETLRQNGMILKGISYSYSNSSEATKVPNTLCIRAVRFAFLDDVAVAEGFNSACAADHTDFDEGKVGQIVKGQTRCDEVIALFGRPSYRGIYPVATEAGNLSIGYHFSYAKRPLLQFKSFQKNLDVLCDSAGVVQEVTYSEVGDR
jgi:hypothetical protein